MLRKILYILTIGIFCIAIDGTKNDSRAGNIDCKAEFNKCRGFSGNFCDELSEPGRGLCKENANKGVPDDTACNIGYKSNRNRLLCST